MKKIITILTLGICTFSFGQFTITPDGYRSVKDQTKDFEVVEALGLTKEQLFSKVKMYLNSKYKGMKFDGYNEVENEQIVLDVNGSSEMVIMYNLSSSNVYTVENRYEIMFKDDRFMVKPKFVALNNVNTGDNIYLTGVSIGISSTGVFNKKGKSIKDKGVAFINDETNKFMSELKNEVVSVNDDW